MAKQRFRKIEQNTTFTKREQYENALTISRLKNRPQKLSFVEIDLNGERANLYFTPIPAIEVIGLRDPALSPIEVVFKMIDMVAAHVVDPYTAQSLMSADDWKLQEEELLNQVFSAVTGLQFVREGEEVADGEAVEVEVDIEELRNEPNPLGETVGSDSGTSSTRNSEVEETSNGG